MCDLIIAEKNSTVCAALIEVSIIDLVIRGTAQELFEGLNKKSHFSRSVSSTTHANGGRIFKPLNQREEIADVSFILKFYHPGWESGG